MDKLPDLSTILSVATAGITASVVVLGVLAPLTKTDRDDKVLRFLRWVESALAKVILPGRRLR